MNNNFLLDKDRRSLLAQIPIEWDIKVVGME